METLIIPVVTGLVQVVKQAGVPKKIVPFLSLAFGVGLSFYTGVTDPIIYGLVYGLSAVGLYAVTKNTLK